MSNVNRALERAICTLLLANGPMTANELTRDEQLYELWLKAYGPTGGLCFPLLCYEDVYPRLRYLQRRGNLASSPLMYDKLWWVVSLVESK